MAGIEREQEEPQTSGWKRWLAGAVVVVLVVWWLWGSWDRQAISEWNQDVHPLVFFLLMAILPAVGFPVTPFYLFAGATYGTALGLAGSWGALAANLALSYWIARSGLRPALKKLLTRLGVKLPEVKEKNELQFTILVKLAPGVPAFAKNYVLALADVSFRIYFWVSLLIAGVYASSFIVLGDSVFDRDPRMAAVAVGSLLVFLVIVAWWRKSRSKRGEEI